MTKKINKNGVNTSNSKNKNQANSNANISKSRNVNIYHADGKTVLLFLGMITVAMTLMFGFCLNSIMSLDGKVAGIIAGLAAYN